MIGCRGSRFPTFRATAYLVPLLALVSTVAHGELSVDIVDHGIYQLGLTGEDVVAHSTAAGALRPAREAKLVAETNLVPARVGVSFGYGFVVQGATNPTCDLEVVVKHPPLGPPNTKPKETDRIRWTFETSRRVWYAYTFDEAWEAVSGQWSIEIWDGKRRLANQTFAVLDGPTAAIADEPREDAIVTALARKISRSNLGIAEDISLDEMDDATLARVVTELRKLIWQRVSTDYVQRRMLGATDAAIQQASDSLDELNAQHAERWRSKLALVEQQLADPNLDDAEAGRLEARRIMLIRLLERDQRVREEAAVHGSTASGLCAALVETPAFRESLRRDYGGRAAGNGTSVARVSARCALMLEHEKAGRLTFHNETLRREFWKAEREQVRTGPDGSRKSGSGLEQDARAREQ